MHPPDMSPPISERRAALLCSEALDHALADADARIEAAKLADDPFAERTEDEPAAVDDPYPDDFRDYYRAIELDGAL